MELFTGYIVEMIWVVLLFFGGMAWRTIHGFFETQKKIDLARYLDMDAIPLALKRAKKEARKRIDKKATELDLKNETLNDALVFLNTQFPRWLKEYGVTNEALRHWLEVRYNDV